LGIIHRREDVLKGRRWLVEGGLRDLSPDVREGVLRILEAWEGKPSEDRLVALIGVEKTRRIKELLNR